MPTLDGPCKFRVLYSQQLAIHFRKFKIISDHPWAPKERCRSGFQNEVGDKVQHRIATHRLLTIQMHHKSLTSAVVRQIQRSPATVNGSLPVSFAPTCVILGKLSYSPI